MKIEKKEKRYKYNWEDGMIQYVCTQLKTDAYIVSMLPPLLFYPFPESNDIVMISERCAQFLSGASCIRSPSNNTHSDFRAKWEHHSTVRSSLTIRWNETIDWATRCKTAKCGLDAHRWITMMNNDHIFKVYYLLNSIFYMWMIL